MDSVKTRIIVPPNSINDAMEVRRQVFQKEQGINEHLDFDGNDDSAIHVVAYKDEVPVATGRIRFPEDKKES